jgi:hypothetical protein
LEDGVLEHGVLEHGVLEHGLLRWSGSIEPPTPGDLRVIGSSCCWSGVGAMVSRAMVSRAMVSRAMVSRAIEGGRSGEAGFETAAGKSAQ